MHEYVSEYSKALSRIHDEGIKSARYIIHELCAEFVDNFTAPEKGIRKFPLANIIGSERTTYFWKEFSYLARVLNRDGMAGRYEIAALVNETLYELNILREYELALFEPGIYFKLKSTH